MAGAMHAVDFQSFHLILQNNFGFHFQRIQATLNPLEKQAEARQ